MSTKTLVTIGMIVGSLVGGYLPVLFGIDAFSFTAATTSAIGAIIGVWIGYKIGEY